jgi:hypothetical protein
MRHIRRILVRETQGKEHLGDIEVDGGDDIGGYKGNRKYIG